MAEEKLLALILGIVIGTWFPLFKDGVRKVNARKALFIVSKSQPRCWEVLNKETKKVSARLYSWERDQQKAQAELESLAARFLEVPNLLREMRLSVQVNLTTLRLRAFYWLIKFAVWIAGFEGIDFLGDDNQKIAEV